jgi:hypothetical protein
VREEIVRAPTSIRLRETAEVWLEGARAGLIRTRSGDPYQPWEVRAHEQAASLRVPPELGHRRVSEIAGYGEQPVHHHANRRAGAAGLEGGEAAVRRGGL